MSESLPTPEPCDYEPLVPELYELTWMSGHVEKIAAHDVSFANRRVVFLADVNGKMRIQLSALEEDLRTIRSITEDETIELSGPGELA